MVILESTAAWYRGARPENVRLFGGPMAGRYPSLDALRGGLMSLGVVLHVAQSYGEHGDPEWPFHDPGGNVAFDLLSYVIHLFRMPTFFAIAGFFAAMVASRRGAPAYRADRLRRILGPLLVFAPLELAAEATITSWLRGGTVAEAVAGRFDGPVTSWDPWSHLWFLWVLLLVSVGWSALPSTLTARLGDAAVRPRWLVVGLVVQAFALATSPSVVLPSGCGFVPPLLPTLVFAGWFLVGTGAWERRDDALRRLARWAPATSALAVAAFVGAIAGQAAREALTDGVVGAAVVAGLATVSSVATAAFAAAAVGWAHRASIPERTGEYVARSSYWVYLSHHAPAMVVPAVVAALPVPSPVRAVLAMAIVAAFSLATWQIVRRTPVGPWLGGAAPTAARP